VTLTGLVHASLSRRPFPVTSGYQEVL
jgi:hypothetical protein